ncbi:MAG: carbon-nitrogen hydrolase family protein, partial [Helicobacter sp.]|nr:carbon-nitrogen hydrolase family protein [Helicobacter sp.]
ELRFPHLRAAVRGAELVFVPAQWGIKRKNHFETLCQALAIANQCFVLAASGANAQMACSSAIISPTGSAVRDDSADIVSCDVDWEEVVSMRKYIDVGLLGA